MSKLPIDEVIPDLQRAFREEQNIILHAPPGAGKTTRVPLALLENLHPDAGRIIMLEPRRIAAVSAASWMAGCLGEEVGQTVGYSIRFDSCTSPKTRIEVVTEGILTRRIQSDPELAGVALVIFDEFHERSIHSDLGLALCREVQQLRPELKVLVMSATLDLQPLSRLLADAPVIGSEGRSFPVEMKYVDDNSHARLSQKVAATVLRALQETEGDILAFLPGSGEIRECAARLMESGAVPENITICQLYGDLPISEQQKVIKVGICRKIVLATSIAETSLTIEGVRTVIDSGVSRRLKYNSGNGLNRLVTVRESRASAEQRAGRGGRTAPGVCYRLFSQHTLQAMAHHTPPEISVTELSQLLLELSAWGVTDPLQLAWLDAPPGNALESARRLLTDLDLLDDSARITQLGREAVRMPLHPRLGRLLLRSRQLGCPELGCKLAALLSERDLFRVKVGNSPSRLSQPDIIDRLEALNIWLSSRRNEQFLDISLLKTLERVVSQLRSCVGIREKDDDSLWSDDQVCRLLLAAYPDRVARRREGSPGYLLVTGSGALMSDKSAVRGGEYVIALTLDAGNQAEAIIHMAAEIPESVIREERSGHITCETVVNWDSREERVVALRLEQLGSINLSAQSITPPAVQAINAVTAAVRATELKLLTMTEGVRQLQGRMKLVREAFPERDWPDVSDTTLCNMVEEWLTPHLGAVFTAKKIAQLDIADILRQNLDYRQQRELEELAPTHLSVPSGSRIKIDYSGEIPVLAVKLQELFGLATSPAVCGGRVQLLLHLLSPAGRAIQVTRDLKGFWDVAYKDVKKELKGRYPKHPWPDDPWSAVPTRRVKSRM